MITPRWSDWAPGLTQYRGYERSWLRGDLLAGVTVAAYLVPQVMAYATVAGPAAGRRAVGGARHRWPCTRCWARPGSCRSGRSRPPR